ncbi:hypothetical protein QOZ88_06635 [Blastococcus sp. BMG 814]|uniref:Cupredoxin-like domain-containing protein n=1 Tax=Blastococcus carthaginiensis TaxID=3050034 RepID=A0ABT9I9S7_9ACTN|nr:hypothetical protein [Blastococcus carthaginiensis]MDP5182309.1 hypothetical protein [Blastococcus carthaginiensis]
MSPRRAAAALLLLALPVAGCAGTAAPAAEGTAASASDAPATGAPTGTTPAPAPPEAAGQRIEVAVAGGRVIGDTGRVPVPLGEPVTVVVTSDVADEVHLHGYDRLAELVPGQPAELAFDATIPGVFELELHDAGTVLLTLQVG